MQVVAEGVETEDQLNFFRGLDCDIVQGYYFSHPLNADGLKRLLSAGAGVLNPAGIIDVGKSGLPPLPDTSLPPPVRGDDRFLKH
jgi:hypothetical protein